jgi:hypothetical protein
MYDEIFGVDEDIKLWVDWKPAAIYRKRNDVAE